MKYNYQLSKEREKQKIEFEYKIEENDNKYMELEQKIKDIRKNKNMSTKEKGIEILKLQIEQEEIDNDTFLKEQAIKKLYISEIDENLDSRAKQKQISSQEYAHEKQKIRLYKDMNNCQNEIDNYDRDIAVLKMKIRLENTKKDVDTYLLDEINKNISKIKQTLLNTEEDRQYYVDELANENFNYKCKILVYLKNTGKILIDEFNKKLAELEQNKKIPPTEQDLDEIFNELAEQNLKPLEQEQNYEREVSNRSKHFTYKTDEDIEKSGAFNYDMNHEEGIGRSSNVYDCMWSDYSWEAVENGLDDEETIKGFGHYIGSYYAYGLNGEKKDLAFKFAELEARANNYHCKPIFEENKLSVGNFYVLLKLEEVNGLNIKDKDNGQYLPGINQKVYIATYESAEPKLDKFNNRVHKHFREYYIEGKNGLEKIGEELESDSIEKNRVMLIDTELDLNDPDDRIETEFNSFEVDVKKGAQISEVTEYEMQDRLTKSKMSEKLNIGEITEIAKIQDIDFLNDFCKQCEQTIDLNNTYNDIYIVSSINEQGEQDFNIVYGNDDNFEILEGIEATNKSNREIKLLDGMGTPGSGLGQMFSSTKSLKEFVTKDGHRYAISRNKDGNLGFNEIYKENEKGAYAEPVRGMYEYWKKDLIDNYKKAGINQEDLDEAYKNVDNSKEKGEQNQEQSNDDVELE